MAKVPAFAKVFAGRWRIVEMDVWDKGFLRRSRPHDAEKPDVRPG